MHPAADISENCGNSVWHMGCTGGGGNLFHKEENQMFTKITIITAIFTLGITGLAGCSKSPEDAIAATVEHEQMIPQKSMDNHDVSAKSEESASGITNGFPQKPAVGTKAVCPVMKNEFSVTANTLISEYKGKFYAFCCPGCKPQFDQDPEKYI
jgi:YHS domain-containing protein